MIYIITIDTDQARLFVEALTESSVYTKVNEVLSYEPSTNSLKLDLNTAFDSADLLVIDQLIANHDDQMPTSETEFYTVDGISNHITLLENKQFSYLNISATKKNKAIYSMEKPLNDELKEVLLINSGHYRIKLERNDSRGVAGCRFMYSGDYSLNEGSSVRCVYIDGFWRIIS